jgi:predicted 3-demethylubiquinone-9 3-methyltransferase (glyoxalase superfamily)
MQKVIPCLWFDTQAEEAVGFYVSIFSRRGDSASGEKNSRIVSTARYGEEGAQVSGQAKGSVMTLIFELEGQQYMALNGGPLYQFTPAVSFIVNCETQEEVDHFWDRLSEGGEEVQCGWVKDKFGVSWQVVPTILGELMQDKDPRKSERVMKALLPMKKIDINALKRAYEQSGF